MQNAHFAAAQGANLIIEEVFKFNGWPRYEKYLVIEPWFLPYPCVGIGAFGDVEFGKSALTSAQVPSIPYFFWLDRLYWRRFVWGPNRQLERECEFEMHRRLFSP
jgi:hypothetical protein